MDTTKTNRQIMDFLKSGEAAFPLSINERSLQVFGNEKFLASTECKKILNQYGLSIGLFNIYHTPEPFIYYLNRSASKDALIVENKDTWYTMRKILMDTGSICNMDFKALIYGEGRKIQSSFEYINADDTRDIHDIQSFYYFGDIDSSGIDILYKLQKQYPLHQIIPFEIGYHYLFRKKHSGRTKEMVVSIPISYEKVQVLDFLGEDAVNEIYTLCNHDYIIPQELLNYKILYNWELFS